MQPRTLQHPPFCLAPCGGDPAAGDAPGCRFYFPAGKVLLQEGHSDDKFYILLEGQVEVVKSLGSRRRTPAGVREAGNLLGEMSLFSRDGCHTASVRSLTPSAAIEGDPHRIGCPAAPPAAVCL